MRRCFPIKSWLPPNLSYRYHTPRSLADAQISRRTNQTRYTPSAPARSAAVCTAGTLTSRGSWALFVGPVRNQAQLDPQAAGPPIARASQTAPPDPVVAVSSSAVSFIKPRRCGVQNGRPTTPVLRVAACEHACQTCGNQARQRCKKRSETVRAATAGCAAALAAMGRREFSQALVGRM
jgi:hypothetical protein